MKINFDVKPLDIKGNEILDENQKPFLLGEAIAMALLNSHPTDNASGLVKYNRAKLADRVTKGGEIDISVEELADLKEVVGRNCNPIFILRIFDLIENSSPNSTERASRKRGS